MNVVPNAVRAALAAALAALAGCGGPLCQPDRCVSGQVCGLGGRCEEAPLAEAVSPEFVDESSPAVYGTASRLAPRVWGTQSGVRADEVGIGGDEGGRLYLSFSLPAGEIESAVLELHAAEDGTYGAAQRVRVAATSGFERIYPGRLPGRRGAAVARRTTPQPVIRFEVSSLAEGRTMYLVVDAQGPSPGWRIASPGAASVALRPALVVRLGAPAD